MIYTNLPAGQTAASSNQLPVMLSRIEQFRPIAYDDRAAPKGNSLGHNPSIGYGVNLRVSKNMALVLNQIQINGKNVFEAAAALQTPKSVQDVVDAFEEVIGKFPNSITTEAALENKLSNLLGSYFGLPPQQSGNTLFKLDATDAKVILDKLIQGFDTRGMNVGLDRHAHSPHRSNHQELVAEQRASMAASITQGMVFIIDPTPRVLITAGSLSIHRHILSRSLWPDQ